MKYCYRCSMYKEELDFYRNCIKKDGLSNYCKDCCKLSNKKSALKYKDKRKKYIQQYQSMNKKKISEQQHEWYLKNKSHVSQSNHEWDRNNRDKRLEYSQRHKILFPEQSQARDILNCAVRYGKIIKPSMCNVCKKQCDVLHAHHHDYSKPLDVVWVCPQCHTNIHKESQL